MMATEMPAAINQYSMAVAPDSSLEKRFATSIMVSPVVLDGGRGGEVRFIGEVDASVKSVRRVVKRLTAKGETGVFLV